MTELFCPQHGIPALVANFWGLDANIFILTWQIYSAKFKKLISFFRRAA